MNYFEGLNKVDCSGHVEKKGRFSYLSWPFAVAELRKRYPEARWEVVKSKDGLPYTYTDAGCFVEVSVTVEGVSLSQIHPVLDNNNRTIAMPNAFQINTSIQRCLVKAIALHGLGLYIYAGEDLPGEDENNGEKNGVYIPARPKTEELGLDQETIKFIEELAVDIAGMCEVGEAKEAVLKYKAAGIEGDMHIAFQNMIDSKTRTALRNAYKQMEGK